MFLAREEKKYELGKERPLREEGQDMAGKNEGQMSEDERES